MAAPWRMPDMPRGSGMAGMAGCTARKDGGLGTDACARDLLPSKARQLHGGGARRRARQARRCRVGGAHEHEFYEDEAQNRTAVASHCDDLAWCDTLIFVYPTWWYGLPAMIKGWLDRVLVPGLAFLMPDAQNTDIRPGLRHVERLGVFTTCGASFWLTRMIGAPGKRTLLRGVRILCARNCRTVFAAHYLMDSSTDESRARHLRRVATRMDRLVGKARTSSRQEATA